MRTILWFIYFWAYLVAVLPKFYRCKKLTAQGRIKESDAIMEEAVRKWARRLLKAAGVKVEITGLENIWEENLPIRKLRRCLAKMKIV